MCSSAGCTKQVALLVAGRLDRAKHVLTRTTLAYIAADERAAVAVTGSCPLRHPGTNVFHGL